MKVKLKCSVKDNSFGILFSLLFQTKINEMLSEYIDAVHCIQVHQAMDIHIYIYTYKNIWLLSSGFRQRIKMSKRQSNSVKNQVSQQPQIIIGCISLRFGNNLINRESPIQCHFELLKPIPDYVLWSRSRIYIYNSIKLILIKHSTKGLVYTTGKKKKNHNGTLLAYVARGIIHFKKAKCLRWSFASLCKNDDLVQWRHWVIQCPRLRAKADQGPGIPAQ